MTVVIRYTEPIMKRAIFDFIRRLYFTRMIGLSIAAVVLPLLSTLIVDYPWVQAFTFVPAMLIPTILAVGYFLRIRVSLNKLALLDDGKVTITITGSGIEAESALAKSEFKWKLFTELWEFRDEYLLLIVNHHFLTLPKNQVSPEFIALIKERLRDKDSLTLH